MTLKSCLKQDNVAPLPPHNIILFKFNFNAKFPLLRHLQFLSDLKSITVYKKYIIRKIIVTKKILFGPLEVKGLLFMSN